jgi:hypothetical protein
LAGGNQSGPSQIAHIFNGLYFENDSWLTSVNICLLIEYDELNVCNEGLKLDTQYVASTDFSKFTGLVHMVCTENDS